MKKVIAFFLHNWSLKLISLFLAFVLWFIVVQIENPTDTVTFNNIKVSLVNVDLLEKEGKVYEVLERSDYVRVTVRAPKSVIDGLYASDIVAEADVSKLTELNTIVISYDIPTEDGWESITGNHETVKLSIEDKKEKYVPLTARIVGDVAEGYVLGSTTIDQNMIEISGPQSLVDSVVRAEATINVTNATSSLSTNVEIEFYDENNQLVSDSNLKRQTSYVHVSVEVLATKNVVVYASKMGLPAEGYQYTGEIKINPSMVNIAGTSGTLANISRVMISDSIDITGSKEDVVKTIDLKPYLPSNIRFADSDFSGLVEVSVLIEPEVEKILNLSAENIKISNAPDNMQIGLNTPNGSYSFTAKGLSKALDDLAGGTIEATIDVAEWLAENHMDHLNTGTVYEMTAEIHTANGIVITRPAKVGVYVSEKPEAEEGE